MRTLGGHGSSDRLSRCGRTGIKWTVIAGSIFSFLLITTSGESVIERNSHEPSLICESCHSQIFDEWKGSPHAISWEDSLFQDMYAAIRAKDGGVECLSCHAPVALKSGDRLVMEGASGEGVNCDYCHTLQAIPEPAGDLRYGSRPGKVKVGRAGEGRSIYHEILGDDGFGGASYCATCHHFRNPYGVLIYSEYESWSGSPYREQGTTCRDCHMPERTGKASNYGPVRVDCSDHRFSGWRSIELLRQACTFAADLTVTADSIWIRTTLKNHGAGHKFPGGVPIRELVVQILGRDSSGGTIFKDRSIRYGVELEMPEGDSLNVWEARSIIRDTRLDPGERRLGVAGFPLRQDLRKVEVSLLFYPIPLKLIEARKREYEPMVIDRKVLTVR